MIIVLSVMNGFDDELKKRILRVIPHGTIAAENGLHDWPDLAGKLKEQPGLLSSSPYVAGNVLIGQRSTIKGIQLRGIEPAQEAAVSPVANYLIAGNLDYLEPGQFGIVLGSLLAYSLGVSTGDSVVVTLPTVSITLAGVFPRTRQFEVVGVFEAGAQVDQYLALIHLSDAQRLFKRGNTVDGLRLKFDDIYKAPAYIETMEDRLGSDFVFQDWSQTQGSLFRAVKMEKTVTGILLGIIIAVAAFNIVTSLIMMVTEKTANIAVMRTMGMRRGQVMGIFVTQGSVAGIIGVALGVIVGVPCAVFLPEIVRFFEGLFGFHVFDPTVYFVTSLPSKWQWQDTVSICLFALASAFISALYPAYRASLIEPAEATRYHN